MEIKYTTDGKKVVVIGNLNSQDKIVQEIFLVNGVEVPSGENFVVRSLHDAPTVSWQEKRLLEIKTELSKAETAHTNRMEAIRSEYDKARVTKGGIIEYFQKLDKQSQSGAIRRIQDFLSGKITHIVLTDVYNPDIFTLEESLYKEDYGLKLISLYGKDDGTMTFAINQYSDGSGGRTKFAPCSSYEEAVKVLAELITSKPLNEQTYKAALKHNIHLSKESVGVYREIEKKRWISLIDLKEIEIQRYKDDLAKAEQIQ